MTFRRLVLAVFFLSSCANFSFANGKLNFTVDLRDTKSHTVHIALTPSGFHGEKAFYQMPVWAPGAYSVSHYGQYAVNFKAFNKSGDALTVKQLNDDRWQIENGKSVARIEYDVLDSHLDTTSLYFAMANIDTSLFFANATALFGYYDDDKKASAQVVYQFPSDWKLVCALPAPGGYEKDTNPSFKNTTFVAKDYDELADAPILAAAEHKDADHLDHIVTHSFAEGSAIYDVAVATDGSWSDAKMDSLSENLREIVHAETDFFHDTPYKHYTFEIVAPTLSHMPGLAQGALEHANSSDYLLMDLGWSMFKGSFLSIFSHEFFHLWNVKRIHSNLLGPFDYTKRVMTTSLWMAEGITEYYAHTLLSRYGLISPKRFFLDVDQWRQEMAMAPASASLKSLEDLSIDESTFEMDEATLFYTRGPLVALMLDIEIRSRTNNKKSLDDVMFALNNDAKHGKTFGEDELIHKVEKYAGIDLTDFYNKYVHGTDSLRLDTYLAKMGYNPSREPAAEETQIAMVSDSLLFFQSLDPTGPLAMSGVKHGDVLYAINGTKITRDNLTLLYSMDSLKGAKLTVLRDGQQMDIPIVITEKKEDSKGAAGIDPNATPMETAIRKGIVGQ
jgi:predicted metalloprotease with PDZ domain